MSDDGSDDIDSCGRCRLPLPSPLKVFSQSHKGLIDVISIGICFLILFTAFNTVQSFESSVNAKLGLATLASLYTSFTFSSFFAGFLVQKIGGERRSLTCASFAYLIFVLAHLWPAFVTLVPAAALLGLGGALLWAAQGSYLAKIAPAGKLGAYSGVFWGIFQFNAVIGNLVAALLLAETGENTHFMFVVLTAVATVGVLSFPLLRQPKASRRVVVPSSASSTGSRHDGEKGTQKSLPSPLKKAGLGDMIALFKDPKMLLLAPSLVYWGFSQSFFFSRLPQTVPLTHLGFVMATFGFCDAFASVVWGRLSDRWLGRRLTLIAGTCIACIGLVMGFIIASYNFTNNQSDDATTNPAPLWMHFLTFGILGISDGAFNTQLYAVIGAYGQRQAEPRLEAAYAYGKLFQAGSTALTYMASLFLDLGTLGILGIALAIGSTSLLMMTDRCLNGAKIDDRPALNGYTALDIPIEDEKEETSEISS